MWEKTRREDGGIRPISDLGIIDLGNALQTERSQDRFPMGPLGFFIDKHSGRIMVLEATQPVTEMSTRDISLGVEAAGT
jgi:hypothetical protein